MIKKKNKKKVMIILTTVLVVGFGFSILLTILMNRSYANENISSSGVSSNDIMDISRSSDNDYVYFTITKKNSSASISAIFDINLSDKHNEYSSKTIVAKIEQSEDNSTFTEIANKNLSDGNNQTFATVSQTPATVSYYRVSFYADSERLNLHERNIDVNINVRTNAKAEFNYEYQDNHEYAYEFEAPLNGSYTIELWGAAGNYYPSSMQDQVGKGAYTKGVIELTSGDKLYVYTGKNATDEGNFSTASFNAGSTTAGITGAAGGTSSTCNINNNSGSCHNNSSGGGATDVRLIGGEWNDPDSLASRIMVAAGGGGTQFYHSYSNYVYGTGGSGGGLAGYEAGLSGNYFRYIDSGSNSYSMNGEIIESDGTRTTVSSSSSSENYYVNTKHDFTFGGTQKRGGLTNYQTSTTTKYNGLFGVGGNGGDDAGGGGGGGYYGGAGGIKNYASSVRRTCHSPGSGGSSFISGHTGSISIENQNNANCVESGYRPENYVGTTDQSCSLVTYNSKTYQFTDTVMIDGEGYSWTNVRGAKTAMPSPDNREITTGNEGSGAARITYASTAEDSLNTTWSKSTSINEVTVTTNHYVEGTTTPIKLNNGNNSASVVQNLHEGDSYTTSELSDKAAYYELIATPSNATGTVGSANIVVNYYYRLKSYNYKVNYLDKDTGTSIYTAKTGNAVYGSTINATDEIISISTYTYDSADNDSITIGTNASNNVINLYYIKETEPEPTKGSVIVRYVDKNTGSSIATSVSIIDDIGETYTTEQKTIVGYTFVEVSGKTSGTLSGGTIRVTYYYKKQVTVTTNHYVEGTTTPIKLSNGNNSASIVQNLHEGDSYTTSELSNKAEYYELVETPSNATGTVGSANIVVTYYYRLKSYNYTVNYVDKDTGELIEGISPNTGELPYGSTINASNYVININKYTYDSADKTSITIGTNTGNNVINLYYVKNRGKLIVKYIDIVTNENILSEIVNEEKLDTPYNTTQKEIDGYTFIEVVGNTTGYYQLGEIEVVYKYAKNVVLTVNYINKIKNEIMDTDTINAHEGESYHVGAKDYTGFVLVEKPEVEEGVFSNQNITLNYYYIQISSGVIEKHIDVFNNDVLYNKHYEGREGDTYNISSREFEGYDLLTDRLPTNNKGTMKVELQEVIYYYKKRANIKIKYVDDITGEEIIETKEINGHVNDEWKANSLEKEGYALVKTPDEEEGRLGYINEDIVYRYRKIFKVITRVNGDGGSIEGDEIVLEKMSSTPNKIVITAGEKHFIEKVTINGIEIEITNTEKMILDNFTEMSEDKIIEVIFGEIVDVPKTARNTLLPIVAGFILVLGSVMIYLSSMKKKKLKSL